MSGTHLAGPPPSRRLGQRRVRPKRGRAVVVLLLTALAIGAAVAVDVLLPAPEPAVAEPVALDPATSGVWYCPVTVSEEESSVVSVAPATDEATFATLVRHTEDGPVREDAVVIEPADQLEVPLEGQQATEPVSVEWSGGPAVVTWRQQSDDGMGAACEPSASPVWHVTGFDTTAESASSLHLFNPFAAPAAAQVTFGTPTGAVGLTLTENISVQPGESLALDLRELQPELADLAATVQVTSGRLVAQGSVDLQPTENQPGPSGRAVIGGATAPSTMWAFGDAQQSSDQTTASTWLSVYNPNDREAGVTLQVSNPLPESPPVVTESLVPAGGVVRIEVDGASTQERFGLVATSVTEQPIVVTRATRLAEDGEDVAVSRGVRPASRWAVAGARTQDGTSVVSLYNPAARPIEVDLTAGADSPGPVVVSANARVEVDLADIGDPRAGLPVRAVGTGPFVAELRVVADGDDLAVWTADAVPMRAWDGPSQRPAIASDPRLGNRRLPTQTPDELLAPAPTYRPDPGDPVPDLSAPPPGAAPSPPPGASPSLSPGVSPSPSPGASPSPTG